MKFAIIPLSTRSVYVHCIKNEIIPASKTPRIDDRLVAKAAKIWNGFETSETKWKKNLVKTTNRILETIPYTESCLKSIPSKSSILRKVTPKAAIAAQKSQEPIPEEENKKLVISYKHLETSHQELSSQTVPDLPPSIISSPPSSIETPHDYNSISPEDHILDPVVIVYPSKIISEQQSLAELSKLASYGVKTHFTYMMICLIGAPLTLPVALLPVIPNIPGFYLAYRAWCNWKAYDGAKHLSYLTKNSNQLKFEPSDELNALYSSSLYLKQADSSPIFNPNAEPKQLKASENNEQANKKSNNDSSSNTKEELLLTEDMAMALENLVQDLRHQDLIKAIHQVKKSIDSKK